MLFIMTFSILLVGLYYMTLVLSYRMGVFGMVLSHILIGIYFLFGWGVETFIYGNYEPIHVVGILINAFIANLLLFPFAVFAIWTGRNYRASSGSNLNETC